MDIQHFNMVKKDLEELFCRMVFNILCSNGDDHLRNHGFLYDPAEKGWRISPCYDIVPDVNPYGRLGLSAGPHGRLATLENALAGSPAFGLDKDASKNIVERMVNMTRNWGEHFADHGVPKPDIQKLAQNFCFSNKRFRL